MSVISLAMTLLIYLCRSQCDSDVGRLPADRDRRDDKRTLKIVNYNAEWLYTYDTNTGAGTGTKCTDWDRFKTNIVPNGFPIWDLVGGKALFHKPQGDANIRTSSETHMNNIAEYLNILQADIFILEEVCDCDTLEKVRSKLPADLRVKYKSFLVENDKQPQQVGILTKIDPARQSQVVLHDIFSYRAYMDVLYENPGGDKKIEIAGRPKGFRTVFEIGKNNKKIILYGVHLCASCAWNLRERGADYLNTLISNDLTSSPNNYVILTGDFNIDENNLHSIQKSLTLSKDTGGWIGSYVIDSRINNVEFQDSADGIKIQNKGTTNLQVNSKVTKIEIKYVYPPVTHTRSAPTSVRQLERWITDAQVISFKISIRCIRNRKTTIRVLPVAKNIATKKALFTSDKKVGNDKFIDYRGGSVRVINPSAKKTTTKVCLVIGVDLVTKRPDEIVTKTPNTVAELTAVIINDCQNRLTELYDTKIFAERKEETLQKLEQHLKKVDSTQPNHLQYSHKACTVGPTGTSVTTNRKIDYFFVSRNLYPLIDGTMIYVHDGLSGPAPREKICNGYSDHT
eukprot:75220_1